jgi:transposase
MTKFLAKKMQLGHQGVLYGSYQVYLSQDLFASASSVYYWARKVSDETFHPADRGGRRPREGWPVWEGERFETLQRIVRAIFDEYPNISFAELVSLTSELWDEATEWGVRRVLKKWNWSWKVPATVQLNKFTGKNLRRYIKYMETRSTIPDFKVLYLDESHFDSRSKLAFNVYSQPDRKISRCAGPVGEKVNFVNEIGLLESYSMTLMCSLAPGWPIFYEIRDRRTNTGFDFAEFLVSALRFNYIGKGDVIILDNWSGHWCNDNWEVLNELREVFEFELLFLPTYSPELNPCEFVFAQIKKLIRRLFDHPTLLQNIIAACAQVTADHISAYYRHCKESSDILRGVEIMKRIVQECAGAQRNE